MSIYGPVSNEFIVWEAGKGDYLTPNFHMQEFECDMGKWSMVSLVLVDKLQIIRDRLGFALKINSGFRSQEKQAYLRKSGFKTATGVSQHEIGRAVDIDTSNMSNERRQKLIDEASKHFMAIGMAKNFIHLDLRDDKTRTWGY